MHYYDLLRERLMEFPFEILKKKTSLSFVDISRYRAILEKSKKYDNIPFHNETMNWVEIKSEVLLLANTDLRYIFYVNLDKKLNEINMKLDYSLYNNIEKTYETENTEIIVRDNKDDSVYLSIHSVNFKGVHPRCDIVITDNVVTINFFNNWSENMKKILIMKLFNYSDIILCWNFNVSISINLNISKKYNVLLFHLFLNGRNANDIIVNEITKEQLIKTKNYIRIFNIINVIKNKNDISIVKVKNLSVPTKYIILEKWQDILSEFDSTKEKLILYYNDFLNAPVTNKVRKTKKFLTELEERVPELFKNNVKGKQKYSQRCQKKKQPFIVDDIDQYTKNLTKLILDSGKYNIDHVDDPVNIENDAIMAFINDPSNNLSHTGQLLKKFPDPPEEGIPSLVYSCIPRDGNIDNEYKIIDTIQKDGYKTVPCCFIKSRENKNVGLSIKQGYELSGDKNLTSGRSGKLPFYLNEMFPQYKRYGAGSLYDFLLLIMNELEIKPCTLFDKYMSNFRFGKIKETVGIELTKENEDYSIKIKGDNHYIWKFHDTVINISSNTILIKYDIASYNTTFEYLIDTIGENFHYWGLLLEVDFFRADLYVSNGISFFYYNFDKDDKHIHNQIVYVYKNMYDIYEIIYNTDYVLTEKHALYRYLRESYTIHKSNIIYVT